ncbi:MAG: 30S ribosomal protein S20 [Desulfarculaceae bacterium]|nr:30S ribosomal protein S20 [Desulfarculaceae bacterium]MCF8073939.1 30S ribosomal protein S20 [Desulfarculaceae bacterium]MCF8102625.1 30S ribosomal protein S20 [Desulfarculaceae bacterium]MCF8117606.1 30S ribosomal protein S20 [Desulfarculaceae bacterium]
MANHVSALKRARQNLKRSTRNRAYRTRVRSVVKQVRLAIDAGDAEAAQAALTKAVPLIDKAASKGVLHKKNASRKVSRLSSQVAAL